MFLVMIDTEIKDGINSFHLLLVLGEVDGECDLHLYTTSLLDNYAIEYLDNSQCRN